MTTYHFDYTTGNPDNLVGGHPAAMIDLQGSFYDLRAFLNSGVFDALAALSPPVSLAAGASVLDVGLAGQLRAGRQLALMDFTSLGLAAPVGLWNLGDLTNLGSGGNLVNKGAVPFGVGINGGAATAAVFAGSTGQALYIVDTGAADPFRIKTGSWGCWMRTAKRAVAQSLMTKRLGSSQWAFTTYLDAANVLTCFVSFTGNTVGAAVSGVSDTADDRWHHTVWTFDGGTLRAYVDGTLEGLAQGAGTIFPGTSPLNIGAYGADGGTAAGDPHYGRIDEAFITADVLTDDQVRLLYCAKLAHTLGVVPARANLNVRRRRKGATLAAADFPTQPIRLHNFTAGGLNDEGSGGVALTNSAPTLIVPVAGADGTLGNALSFSGAHTGLFSTDAGLPAGTASRSFGCWLKTTASGATVIALSWGTLSSGDTKIFLSLGAIHAANAADDITGPFVADGQWHFAVVVEDNAAGDGVRRKLYLDGRLVAGSTVLTALTLAGANFFRVGAQPNGTLPFLPGQIDGVFITGVALTMEQIAALYAKGTQSLGPSPKEVGAHLEAMDAAAVYVTFDTLDSQQQIDLSIGT